MAGRGEKARSGWDALLGSASGCFGRPGFAVFSTLVAGWVLAPGRRTVTAMIAVAGAVGLPAPVAAHDDRAGQGEADLGQGLA